MNMNTKSETLAAATVSDPRWAAVVARDARCDGQFVYSVRTTGVYCRPSCAARAARPENVDFHATAAEAQRRGFRACMRCKPDQPPLAAQHGPQRAAAHQLLRRIDYAREYRREHRVRAPRPAHQPES